MGAGPIPWSAILRWAGEHDITLPDERDDLVTIVGHLDAIWLKHAAEKMAKGLKGQKS